MARLNNWCMEILINRMITCTKQILWPTAAKEVAMKNDHIRTRTRNTDMQAEFSDKTHQ